MPTVRMIEGGCCSHTLLHRLVRFNPLLSSPLFIFRSGLFGKIFKVLVSILSHGYDCSQWEHRGFLFLWIKILSMSAYNCPNRCFFIPHITIFFEYLKTFLTCLWVSKIGQMKMHLTVSLLKEVRTGPRARFTVNYPAVGLYPPGGVCGGAMS